MTPFATGDVDTVLLLFADLADGKCTEFWNFVEHEQEMDEFFS